MVADPDQVTPGEQVALSFPEGTGRGLGFALDQQTEDGWQRRAYLTSAPAEGRPKRTCLASPRPATAMGIARDRAVLVLMSCRSPVSSSRAATASAT
jgi:hypothetical protein